MNDKVTYIERDGKLFYEYGGRKKKKDFPYIGPPDITGEVPVEIYGQGKRAVREYVRNEIGRIKTTRERFKKFGENLNVPVSVTHKGVLLKGKLIFARKGYVKARLEIPEKYCGEYGMGLGYGSIPPEDVFEKGDKPKLNRIAIESAEECLRRIYDKKKYEEYHKDLIRLAEELNGG